MLLIYLSVNKEPLATTHIVTDNVLNMNVGAKPNSWNIIVFYK